MASGRDSRAGERGQVLPLVALAMVVLLGAVGLALDGGRIFLERRDAQGAADQAALAAAYRYCTTRDESAARTAGMAAALANGYDNGATNDVVITPVNIAGGRGFTAVITSQVGATFARVVGASTFNVGADSLGGCIGGSGGGPGAIFAGGDTCNESGKYTFLVSGSSQRVYGGIHSNQDVWIETSPNWWTNDGVGDPFTFYGVLRKNPSPAVHPTTSMTSNVYQTGYPLQETPRRDWPAGYGPTAIAGKLATYKAMAVANGTYFERKVIGADLTKPGVYYSTQEIEIGSISGDQNITLVSERTIFLSTSGNPPPTSPLTLNPFVDGLLVFSSYQHPLVDDPKKICDEDVVEMIGSNINWNGVIWAPLGLVSFPGSGNATIVNGSVVSWAVRFGGSSITIQGSSGGSLTPGKVLLIE